MLSGLYSAATGIHVAHLRQELIAENLAHVDVPGYRGQYLAIQSLDLEQEQQASSFTAGVEPQEITRDFSPGQIQRTGRALDVAIQGGDGFFVLQSPEGPVYTRAGVFHTNAEGTLISSAGYPVLGTGGTLTIPPDVSSESVVITREGQVIAGTTPVGQLSVVMFSDRNRLQPVGEAIFQPPVDMPAIPIDNPHIQQGYRELSNVSATSELINMLIGVRYHEAAQRALTTISEEISEHIDAEGG